MKMNFFLLNFTIFILIVISTVNGDQVQLESTQPTKISDNFTQSKEGLTVCYGVLGCFGLKDFFNLKRPINLLPNSPEDINVTFILYTDENRYRPSVLGYDSSYSDINQTKFDPQKPTKFIIHGYTSRYNDMEWMGNTKDLIIHRYPETFNIFGVDWSKGAGKIIYSQAAANTRVVGAAIAHFIAKLIEYTGTSADLIHLIGHSLGAHCAGYAGKRITDPKLARITALDPAGPNFYSTNPVSRLNYNDAQFVDVVHTDYGNLVIEGLGLEDAVGNVDFFVNGGYRQPGCGKTQGVPNVVTDGIVDGLTETVTCNHGRATELFGIDPGLLDERCEFVGYKCDSYEDFEAGACGYCDESNSQCAVLDVWGEYSLEIGKLYVQQMDQKRNETDTRYYFKTTKSLPFCLHHHQIQLKFADDSEMSTGSVKLDLTGTRRSVKDVDFSTDFIGFKAGKIYTLLMTYEKPLGIILKSDLKWKFGGVQLVNPFKLFNAPKVKIEYLQFNYMSNINPKLRAKFSSKLCPSQSEPLQSGSTVEFIPCDQVSNIKTTNSKAT